MKRKISFTVQSLLFYTDRVRGPIEQVLFAEKIRRHLDLKNVNQLARVHFSDPYIHQSILGQEQPNETLIIGSSVGDKVEQHLFVRVKKTGLFVATGTLPDRTIEIQDDYKQIFIMKKLSEFEIEMVYAYLWDNPNVLDLRPATDQDWLD